MQVELGFRLYMMRFGLARLVTAFTNSDRPTSTTTVRLKLTKYLTTKVQLSALDVDAFRQYLDGKPGSPRYTPLRRSLSRGELPFVERQDLWLATDRLESTVGSLTENYYDDPIQLAQVLGLIKGETNILLSRGRLCYFDTKDEVTSPFPLDRRQSLFLGLWLLSIDSDWLWAFLKAMSSLDINQVNVENRVSILLHTFDTLLGARQLSSGSNAYLAARRRLLELKKITERNVEEDLNLGQPWSWFLVPRLELLVDAGLLAKSQPHDLKGYQLSTTACALQRTALATDRGAELLAHFFAAHFPGRPVAAALDWSTLEPMLRTCSSTLRSPTGYYPLYETASATCITNALENTGNIWEIPSVEAAVKGQGVGPKASLVLGIDKFGAVHNFRFREH